MPDKRDLKLWWQRRTRGWSDDETWSLDHSLAKHILPRLKRYREIEAGWSRRCKNQEEWNKILDKMIFAMEHAVKGHWDVNWTEDDHNRAQEGAKLFGKYFFSLWW